VDLFPHISHQLCILENPKIANDVIN